MPARVPKGWESTYREFLLLHVEIILGCLVILPLTVSIILVWDGGTLSEDWWIPALSLISGGAIVVGFFYLLSKVEAPHELMTHVPLRAEDAVTVVRAFLDEKGLEPGTGGEPLGVLRGVFDIDGDRVHVVVLAYNPRTTRLVVSPYPFKEKPDLDELLTGLRNACLDSK